MNLLMIAPLCDSRGKIRYHIGAQVDVSGLAKDCTDLESLQKLVIQQQNQRQTQDDKNHGHDGEPEKGDEFQELSEMLNMGEREYQEDDTESSRNAALYKPRLLLEEPTADGASENVPGKTMSGRLKGVYQNVCHPFPQKSNRS